MDFRCYFIENLRHHGLPSRSYKLDPPGRDERAWICHTAQFLLAGMRRQKRAFVVDFTVLTVLRKVTMHSLHLRRFGLHLLQTRRPLDVGKSANFTIPQAWHGRPTGLLSFEFSGSSLALFWISFSFVSIEGGASSMPSDTSSSLDFWLKTSDFGNEIDCCRAFWKAAVHEAVTHSPLASQSMQFMVEKLWRGSLLEISFELSSFTSTSFSAWTSKSTTLSQSAEDPPATISHRATLWRSSGWFFCNDWVR